MRGRKLWWIVLLGIFLAGTALAQTVRLMPVPPHIKPRWTRVRGSPRVFHAPNVPADVFRGPGGYYLLLDNLCDESVFNRRKMIQFNCYINIFRMLAVLASVEYWKLIGIL